MLKTNTIESFFLALVVVGVVLMSIKHRDALHLLEEAVYLYIYLPRAATLLHHTT